MLDVALASLRQVVACYALQAVQQRLGLSCLMQRSQKAQGLHQHQPA